MIDDCHKYTVGRDLLKKFGLLIVQQLATKCKSAHVIRHNSTCKIKQAIALQIPELVSRMGLFKTHFDKQNCHQKYKAKHQKSQCIPINLKPKVTEEFNRLQIEGHTEKLSNCSNDNFLFSIRNNSKERSLNTLAFNSIVSNKSIHKNTYQMPDIETIIISMSQSLQETQNK